jgi:hypothetical protein
MENIFENSKFRNRINKIEYKKNRIIEIFNEMKEANKEISIDNFICILDKIIDPTTSCMRYSSVLYKSSVEMWNNYIFSTKKNFDLMISYEKLCF